MDCTGGADELAALRGLTVWIWRVVAGNEVVMIDSGPGVADLSGHARRGFGRCPLSLGWAAGLRRASSGESARR